MKRKRSPKNRVGEKHVTNEGCEIEIIEYYTANNCTIRFNNGLVLKNKIYSDIRKGSIRNLNIPYFYNRGFISSGDYNSSDYGIFYDKWRGMFERCYSGKYEVYNNCIVTEEWYNFQIFAKWMNYNYTETMQGWQLDKDILVKGNKIYSPETCCFVPREINSLFTKTNALRGECPIGVHKGGNKFMAQLNKGTGSQYYLGSYNTPEEAFQAYKTEKEKYIKEVADKWKDLIDPRVYEAMYNYKVEITD
jgi:hypothetical protein